MGLCIVTACGASTAAPPETTETPNPNRCGDLVIRYRAVLASASGTCESNADCGVYGGLDPEAVCGGSTDTENARALTEISNAAHEAQCSRPAYSCPAIIVQCSAGRCR